MPEKKKNPLAAGFAAGAAFLVGLGELVCRGAAGAARILFRCAKAPFDLLIFLFSKLVFSFKDGLRAVGGGRRGAVRYVAFWMLPVMAGAMLLGVIVHYRTLSVGLRISAGGTVLGYLRSENEFLEAKNAALGVLSLGTDPQEAARALPETGYSLELVGKNRFTSAAALRDALLALSAEPTEEACGVYIDGGFLCAVKNQSDAKAVFDEALSKRQSKAEGAMLSFVQHIEYVQGVYPETEEVLWGRRKLEGFVNDLLQTRLLSVKEMRPETVSETVKAPAVEIPSDALYIGTSRVLSRGRNGSDQVTRLVTYVDGEKTEEKELFRMSVVTPVPEQLQVGTRALDESFVRTASFGGILIWPAVGATNINSGYEYRWGRLHAAIDIGSRTGSSMGKTVVAAAEGTVIVAGVHSSYGYYVKIDHGNGMQTLYAHCMAGSLMVRAGDHVSAGAPIARIGMTGYATGPHLHFEVIINGNRVNPRPYLGI